MSKHNINISVDAPIMSIKRENDCPIMEAILDTQSFSHKEFEIAKQCCLYLQVFMVLNVVSGCGKHLWKNCVLGVYSKTQ